jgi:hypothetical protein
LHAVAPHVVVERRTADERLVGQAGAPPHDAAGGRPARMAELSALVGDDVAPAEYCVRDAFVAAEELRASAHILRSEDVFSTG